MTLESSTDLANFFDTDEHGTAATYSGSTVNGIFDNEFFEADGGTVGVESAQPLFTCQTDDVSGIAHGDSITISGTAYTVRGVQPDGTGVTQLILEA